MKSIDITNPTTQSKGKITLRDYFNSLPDAAQIAPRKNLIVKVATRCSVPYSTARSWLAYGTLPRNEKHIEILSEITSIPVEDLFEK